MNSHRIIRLSDEPSFILKASEWFHEKWGIPRDTYLESMNESRKKENAVPAWYIAVDGVKIIAGLGVIENDFHDRKDLTPNVCAVFVDIEYRNRGIAGEMLRFVCDDMKSKGFRALYLLTDHASFYERYGWEFLCTAHGDGEEYASRMYIHKL